MKIVIINGSARKGNTLTAINAFIKGAAEKNEIEVIAPDKLRKQFDCMASYLSWDMLFQKCYYANARDELAKDVDAIQKLENLGKNV